MSYSCIMDLYARVNILGGRAVRLKKGDLSEAMALDTDPLARAKGWVDKGVDYLLAVDLDAAAYGSYRNRSLIDRMLEEVDVPMVVAGGVRSDLEASRLIERGAWRVMMGTAAIEDQNMVWDLCRTYPGRMMVSMDVLETEELVTRGWTSNSGRYLEEVLLEMSSAGVSGFFISEARRDILSEAPNTEILRSALDYVEEPVIAAGGVRHLDDLRTMMTLEARGRTLAGLVVGREVTEGRFTIDEAQAILTGTDQATLSRVRQVRMVIECESLQNSTDFYEGMLGFRRLDSWSDDEHQSVLVEASDGRLVELHQPNDPKAYKPPSGFGMVFIVDDVDAWHSRMHGQSAKISMGLDDRPWGHRSFGLEDPDEVPVTIAQIIR